MTTMNQPAGGEFQKTPQQRGSDQLLDLVFGYIIANIWFGFRLVHDVPLWLCGCIVSHSLAFFVEFASPVQKHVVCWPEEVESPPPKRVKWVSLVFVLTVQLK